VRVSEIQLVTLADACELRARVEPDDLGGNGPWEAFDLWYRFPEWCAPWLSADNGDPFLAALLVPAMTLGERLKIPVPVSPALLHALPDIQSILHCFDPRQRPIDVVASRRDPSHRPIEPQPRVGLFFSLGVDSFYSLLKNARDHPGDEETISHLIAVHGMDVWNEPWDERFPPAILDNSQRVAAETGKTLLPVVTNMRAATNSLALWTMGHGGGLASIALALGSFFSTVHIAATTTYDQLYPWGSHPVLDPHWSTEWLHFVHDGAELDRIGKTQLVAQLALALETIRVCPGYTADYNCGRCVKCLPTMIDLLQVGVLHRCQTLPHTIDAEQLRLVLEAYRGGLNVEGYRRRYDAFAGSEHQELRAVLGEYLAKEDHATREEHQGARGIPSQAHSFLRRLRRQVS
jgi:hypothetical protein